VVAALLALTALAVIVPVAVQGLRREYRLGQAWPHLLVAAGILVVAAAYGLYQGTTQGVLAVLGFVTVLVGMLALQRRR
jgi:hypothetical protein